MADVLVPVEVVLDIVQLLIDEGISDYSSPEAYERGVKRRAGYVRNLLSISNPTQPAPAEQAEAFERLEDGDLVEYKIGSGEDEIRIAPWVNNVVIYSAGPGTLAGQVGIHRSLIPGVVAALALVGREGGDERP